MAIALAIAAPASAQSDKEAARELANKGFELYQKGQYAEAYATFKKAEEKYHAPTILVLEGRAAEKLGKVELARELYLKVASEILDLTAPPEFQEAQKQAREALAALDAAQGGVVVVVRGTTPKQVSIEVDGKPATLPAPGQPLVLAPGKHVIVGTTASGAIVSRSVNVAGGVNQRVELVFEAVPEGPPDNGQGRPSTPKVDDGKGELPDLGDGSAPKSRPAADDDGPSLTLGVVGLVAGGVGLGVGVIAGLNTLNRVNDLKKRCLANVCPASDASKADDARTMGTISTIGFVAGGVLAAAGGAYIVVQLRAPKKPTAPSVGLALGPSSIGAWGKF